VTCKARPRHARRARVTTCHPRPRCGQLRKPVLLPPTKIRTRGAVHYVPDGTDTATTPRRNR
jgi:hypothetical protein